MWTVIILMLVLVWVYGACTWIINSRKKGQSSCGGDCAHCGLKQLNDEGQASCNFSKK